MNTAGSPIRESETDDSQVPEPRTTASRSGDKPSGDAADDLANLGRLLRGHTWRDSRDWARALDQLSQLSEDDLKRVINAPAERRPT